jgi:membrane-bound lytic murein transglycosylase A
MAVAELPGWNDEDHAAALAAFQAGCGVAHDPAFYDACLRGRQLGAAGEAASRRFFETHFEVAPIGGDGVLTGYFVPEYEARDLPTPPFTAPVRSRAGATSDDRAAIEASEPAGALAWMKPEDLFFMQIQDSGILDFPGGKKAKAQVAATNGKPFVAIASTMRERGLLQGRGASGDAIHAWLADHRGPQAEAIMDLDPRYIFFDLAPDDGHEPAGTAGVPLTPGRAIAVDADFHPLGGLYWIDGSDPVLEGAAAVYRRLVMALDTGGAIKGSVRADLYLGRGPEAGETAGAVRHALVLYQLVPRGEAQR